MKKLLVAAFALVAFAKWQEEHPADQKQVQGLRAFAELSEPKEFTLSSSEVYCTRNSEGRYFVTKAQGNRPLVQTTSFEEAQQISLGRYLFLGSQLSFFDKNGKIEPSKDNPKLRDLFLQFSFDGTEETCTLQMFNQVYHLSYTPQI